ncbi:MAG: mandelate racemase/muconate lactonizing enzyme family protein, partial [Planctomycetota bacterium]
GPPRDIKITRIVGFDLPSRRPKLVGKNSRRGIHGDRARDRMVRVFTNAGIEGLGNCRLGRDDLAKLLGKNPLRWFDSLRHRALFPSSRRPMDSPLGTQNMPLWDLAGKALKKPVYELLGGRGPKRVPVYDGSIYFADLLPQYADRWKDRFRQEVDMARKQGHRAVKVKIGRGAKWMDRAEGDRRDVEVLQVIRRHAGDDLLIGVDANNGYDLPGTKRFLGSAGELNLAFVEEMFPEKIDECLELKRFMAGRGWKTLLADGETQGDLNVFKPFIQAKAIDVLQGDMNRFGIGGIITEASWAKPQGILVAPHNWGSLIGFYMQLHIGRAIANFYRAERDPLSTDLLIAEGYKIVDGTCSVPDAPGFGLKVDEEKFRDAKINFDLKA